MKFTTNEIKLLLEASYDKEMYNVLQFYIDESVSNERVKCYTMDDTNDVVVTHRGSADLQDWMDNSDWFRINTLKKSKTFKMHQRQHKIIVSKYGAGNIIVMGHSRGGLYATQLYKQHLANQLITYNKPINLFDIVKDRFKKNKQDENSTAVRTSNDLVSVGQKLLKNKDNDVEIDSDTLNPLTEHSMDKLNDSDEIIGQGIGKNTSVYNCRKYFKYCGLKITHNGKYKTKKQMLKEIQ